MSKYIRAIVKIQKPLFSSDGSKLALIYNKDRSMETTQPWTDELEEVFGDDVKQYWLADIPQFDKGYIKLVEQVEEQDW